MVSNIRKSQSGWNAKRPAARSQENSLGHAPAAPDLKSRTRLHPGYRQVNLIRVIAKAVSNCVEQPDRLLDFVAGISRMPARELDDTGMG